MLLLPTSSPYFQIKGICAAGIEAFFFKREFFVDLFGVGAEPFSSYFQNLDSLLTHLSLPPLLLPPPLPLCAVAANATAAVTAATTIAVTAAVATAAAWNRYSDVGRIQVSLDAASGEVASVGGGISLGPSAAQAAQAAADSDVVAAAADFDDNGGGNDKDDKDDDLDLPELPAELVVPPERLDDAAAKSIGLEALKARCTKNSRTPHVFFLFFLPS